MIKTVLKYPLPHPKEQSIMIVRERSEEFYDKIHYHEEAQLTAIVEGEGLLNAGTSLISIQPGDIVYLGPQLHHFFKSNSNTSEEDKKVEYVSLFFDWEMLEKSVFQMPEFEELKNRLIRASGGFKISGKENTVLFNALVNYKVESPIEDAIWFLNFIKEVVTIPDIEYINPNFHPLHTIIKNTSRNKSIIDFILNNLSEDLALADVAKQANMSVSHFSRYFKQETGLTFLEFMNGARLENACNLLLRTDVSVQDISTQVGYNNVSNFIKQFKRKKSISPLQFRRLGGNTKS